MFLYQKRLFLLKRIFLFSFFSLFSSSLFGITLGRGISLFLSGGSINLLSGYIAEDVFDGNGSYKKSDSSQRAVMFSDVVGVDHVIAEVNQVVDFLKHPNKYKNMGAKMPRGILLEGPPGNGKTLIAKAIANEVDCNFYYESASSFVEMYVGVGARRVRKLFAKANKNLPAIIFIDEIDAIGAVNRRSGGNEEYRQTLNEILCQMDGFVGQGVLVIAATNNAESLDTALTRPGRFTKIIKIGNPDYQARKKILLHYIKRLPSVNYADNYVNDLSLKTDGFSAAGLENLVNEAALLAVSQNSGVVASSHFEKAFIKVKNRTK